MAQGSRQRIKWTMQAPDLGQKENNMEELFADFFGEPPNGQSQQDNATIRAPYGLPRIGAVPLLDDKTRFTSSVLSPNAAA